MNNPNNNNMNANNNNMNATPSFYADIMSDAGMGGKTFATASTTQSASTSFFAEKRAATKDRVVDTKSDIMVFDNVGARSRGIRPWEQARFEADQRRQKDAEFFRQQKMLNKPKPKPNPVPAAETNASLDKFQLPTIKTGWMPTQSNLFQNQKVFSSDQIVVDAWDD
jgi:hypothetical protein